MLGGGLQFDNLVAGGHDEVHVDVGARIFFVVEIEKNFAVDDAHADRRYEILDRRGRQSSRIDQALQGQAESYERSGDRSGARASVGLDYIAIDPDGAFAQTLQISNRAQRASDQALNFLRAAALFSLGCLAR